MSGVSEAVTSDGSHGGDGDVPTEDDVATDNYVGSEGEEDDILPEEGRTSDDDSGRYDDVSIPDDEVSDGVFGGRWALAVSVVVVGVVGAAYIGAAVLIDDGGTVSDGQQAVEIENGGGEIDGGSSGASSASEADATVGNADRPEEKAPVDPEPNRTGADPPDAEVEALKFTSGEMDGRQIVRLVNTGEAVDTRELMIDVSTPDANATLFGFPMDRIDEGNVRGEDIFDYSYTGVGGAAGKTTWEDEELFFRIKYSGDGGRIGVGENISVEVTHIDSGEKIYSSDIVAERP